MVCRKIIVSAFLGLILPFLCKADIGLEYSDHSRAVLYRDGDRVYFEKCEKTTPPYLRGCSGKPQDQLFSTEFESYVRSLLSFSGVIDRMYAGVPVAVLLEEKIKNLRDHLIQNRLSIEEIKLAESVLSEKEKMRETILDINQATLQKLEKGQSMTLSEDFQKKKMRVLNLCFFSVMYHPTEKKIYKLSEPVTYDKVKTGCQSFGKDWEAITQTASFTKSLRKTLSESALVPKSGKVTLWSEFSGGAGYRVVCTNFLARQGGAATFTATWSVYDYRNKNATSSFGVCGPHSQMLSSEYIPAKSKVVDLGEADFDLAPGEAATESAEKVVSSIQMPLLCSTNFSYEPAVESSNEEGSLHFRLETLEKNLEKLARKLYAYKASYVKGLGSVITQFSVDSSEPMAVSYRAFLTRYFALEMLLPVIETTETPFVKEKIFENFKSGITAAQKRLDIKNLSDVELTKGVYQVAFASAKLALQNSLQFILDETLKNDAHKMITDLGMIEAAFKAQGHQKFQPKALLEVLDSNPKLIESLKSEPRTLGFGVVIEKIKSYLKEKI